MKESKVLEFVIKEEEREGRRAIDVSKSRKGYDIESYDKKGNVRYIEVKRRNYPKQRIVFLTLNEFMNFVENENMWLYVVYKTKEGKLDIIKLNREKVLKGIIHKVVLHFKLSLSKKIVGKDISK
ncbi:MAG: DUF3883 domain-containing protein [Candidatus Aenigmatarchaeota archaeon]